MAKFFKSKAVKIIALVMVAVLALGALSYFSGGIAADWFDRQRNPDNLITMDDYIVTDQVKRTEGITLDVDELGGLTVNGSLDTSYQIEIDVIELVLEPGTYTLTGAPDAATANYCLVAKWVDSNGATQNWLGDFTAGRTKTFTEEVSLKILVRIQPGYEFDDVEILPVLSKGKTPVEFYNDNGVWKVFG